MKKKLLYLIFIIYHLSFSQWSTSPYADSGLYVCQGFDPGIVTFNDGSSIVLGMLSSYIYAQKLDPAGYKLWPQPVLVFHNDSSDMSVGDVSNSTWFCSDGDGGVILFWEDYRGAYYSETGAQNSTTYLQRVDKNGTIKWGAGGIQVNNLADGYKTARIVSDDSGGCVLLYSEYGFAYPNAPNKNYLKIDRYNSNGESVWLRVLDSSFTNGEQFQLYNICRGGLYYYFNLSSGGNIQYFIDENGDLASYKSRPISEIEVSETQNVFFSDLTIFPSHFYKISKLDYQGDTTWTKTFSFENFCSDQGGILIPDIRGGTFLTHSCDDSIIYFDSLGNYSYKEFNGIDSFNNYFFSDGSNGLLAANSTTVRRYDNTGKTVWPNDVIYLTDAGNAYSQYFSPDKNGGFIDVYWSTLGGIYAQHTGRNGKLGIVTGIKAPPKNIPLSIQLYQNYPNPFNGSTQIKYTVSEKSKVTLIVYDVLGRIVASVVNTVQEKGTYTAHVDLPAAASGVYFYRLMTDGQIQITHKMLLTK